MIQKVDLQGVHLELDDNIKSYVSKKLAQMDKYLSKKIRQAVKMEVILKETKLNNHNNCTCEVNFYLPKEIINVKETTINIYAAIDIVETKLKQKVRQYSELHNYGRIHRHLIYRFIKKSNK